MPLAYRSRCREFGVSFMFALSSLGRLDVDAAPTSVLRSTLCERAPRCQMGST